MMVDWIFLNKKLYFFAKVHAFSYWHSTFSFQWTPVLSNIRVLKQLKRNSMLLRQFLSWKKKLNKTLPSYNISQVLILIKPFCMLPSFKNCCYLVRMHIQTNVLKLLFTNINILTNSTQACLTAVWGPSLLSRLGAYAAQQFPKHTLDHWFQLLILKSSFEEHQLLSHLATGLPGPSVQTQPTTVDSEAIHLASNQTVIFLLRRKTWFRWCCPNQSPARYYEPTDIVGLWFKNIILSEKLVIRCDEKNLISLWIM